MNSDDDGSLPTAAPVAIARTAARKKHLRIAAIGALLAGVAASAAVVAIAQPSQAELTATATVVDQDSLPVELTIGTDAMTQADHAIDKAETAIDGAASSVDTDELHAYVSKLKDYDDMGRSDVVGLTADASSATRTVIAETAQVREEKAAEKKRKAEEAARKKAEEKKAAARAKAEEERAAAAIAAAQSPAGARDAGRRIAANEFGWGGDQFGCLSNLWQKESGWNYQAQNASSGAYGIPQALPGSKMTSIAADWQTNPLTQIRWGLRYIQASYGTPCAAWGHSQAMNWY